MFLLYGMGGIGKTQICLKFAEEMSDLISKVFWVDASSTDTITLSLKAISGNADTSALSTLQQIAVLEDEWLLVFDNADGGPEVVEMFLPPGNKGNILITSRNLALQRITLVENSLGLPEMAKADAVILLQKSSGLVSLVKDQPELAEKIVSELYCLPLAVDQAGAAIHSGLCDVHKYLELLSKQRQRLMSHPLFRGASQYDRTVYGTFELSYGEIEARATRPDTYIATAAQTAILILQTCAFYHHDNILKDIFKHAAENSRQQDVEDKIKLGLPLAITSLDYRLLPVDEDGYWDEFFFNDGLQVLLSFSLIKKDLSSNVFSMHPLVHYWSQDRMSKSLKQEYCQIGRIILSCAILFGQETEHYKQRQRLLPHINANYQYGNQIGLEQSFRDDEYGKFSMVFGESGDWKKKEALDLELVSKRRDILGLEHPDTLWSMSILASTYQNQRHWKKAEELQVQVLETIKRLHGSEHPDTLRCMSSLASTYKEQGHLQKAEELEIQVLEPKKKILGLQHPDTLASMENLASIYWHQGHLQKAEELQVQVLEKMKQVLGSEHRETLGSMFNLALTYKDQGRLQKAEELEVQILETRKKVLGSEHPDTLTSMSNLAATYWSQGSLQKTEELGVQVLEQRKKLLGLEHPDTLTSMDDLAAVYRDQGNLQKAEELGVQALGTTGVLGLEHQDTLTKMCNLSLTYRDLGHLQKAEEMQIQALETTKKVLGSEHPLTLLITTNLALTYWDQGRFQEAEELHVQALEISKRVLGIEHPATMKNISNLATIYHNQGRFQQAEELHVQASETSQKVLGLEHPLTLTIMQNLALTYQIQGHLQQAEELGVQVLEQRKKLLGLEHPDTLMSMGYLAGIFKSQSHNTKAIHLMQETVLLWRKTLGPEHSNTQESEDTLNKWIAQQE
ncbi:hypothetical protein B0H34DRAFT_658284 [Crassisporium funariophilum]|nr:hypothetical protein B0H34DRAFT_658284 [Crassisporium funariophilum]